MNFYKTKILSYNKTKAIIFSAIIFAGIFCFSSEVFADYNTSGLLRSTNLLSGTNGAASIDSFDYTVSVIPANTTLQISFTGDGSEWYAADGTLGGWTSLEVGSNSVDLSGLVWQGTHFAYKIYMTSDGSDTPVLTSVALNYTPYSEDRGVYTHYEATGTLISTDLLDGINNGVSIDGFGYTVSSLPSNTTASVQFSQDQSSWYGSDGVLDNSDALSAGSNSIDLSGLSWTAENFYYKLTFASLSYLDTAVLTSITLNYTEDTQAPTTSASATAGGSSYTFDTWTNASNVSATLTCSDGLGLGCQTTYYCQNTTNTCTPTTEYSSAVSITTENTSYIRYYSTDTSGNTETTASQTIKIDTTDPVTSLSFARNETNQNIITATLTCSDGSGVGCATTYYCTDLTNECTPATVYTDPATFSISNNTYIRYYSIDNVSNSETTKTEAILLMGGSASSDSAPPQAQNYAEPYAEPRGNETPPVSEQPTGLFEQATQQISKLTQQATDFALNLGKRASEIAKIFGPRAPSQIAVLPEEVPSILQGWDLMTSRPVGDLALTSVPSTISFFASNFPQLESALSKVGVDAKNYLGLEKLSGIGLFIPGLSQTVLSKAEIEEINKSVLLFASVQGVPVAKLTAKAIADMPSNIVFAKTAGELIDFKTELLVDNKGDVEQRISIVSGKPLQLVVKPDQPAEKVLGFITLKKLAQNQVEEHKSVAGFFSRIWNAALTLGINSNKQTKREGGLLVGKFEYFEEKDGVYLADITMPVNEGEYEILTVIEYEDKSINSKETRMTALVDPEGYVYSQLDKGRLRLEEVEVSLYWLNPEIEKYELWPAEQFYQTNPVVTGETGKYSFLAPEGTYYITAELEGYKDFKSDVFAVKDNNNIHMDVELKEKATLLNWLNWNTAVIALLLLVVVLLAVIIVYFIKIKGRK